MTSGDKKILRITAIAVVIAAIAYGVYRFIKNQSIDASAAGGASGGTGINTSDALPLSTNVNVTSTSDVEAFHASPLLTIILQLYNSFLTQSIDILKEHPADVFKNDKTISDYNNDVSGMETQINNCISELNSTKPDITLIGTYNANILKYGTDILNNMDWSSTQVNISINERAHLNLMLSSHTDSIKYINTQLSNL